MSPAGSSSWHLVRAFSACCAMASRINLSINSRNGMPLASHQAVRLESAIIAAKCFTDILRNGYEQRPVRGDKLLFLEDVGCSCKI